MASDQGDTQREPMVFPAVAELLAAGDAMAKLIADKQAGDLASDIAALRRWAAAIHPWRDQ